MIVVVGRVKTDAEKRAHLVQVAQTVAAASRAEAGCLGYRIYQDTESDDDFVFVEEWADDAALEQHFRTPHIATFMQAIPTVITAPPDVKFHTIAATKDLAEVSAG